MAIFNYVEEAIMLGRAIHDEKSAAKACVTLRVLKWAVGISQRAASNRKAVRRQGQQPSIEAQAMRASSMLKTR